MNTLWLWSVAKDLRRVTCEMTDKGLLGVEIQLIENGRSYQGRRYVNRGAAEIGAAEFRRNLERDGWILVSPE